MTADRPRSQTGEASDPKSDLNAHWHTLDSSQSALRLDTDRQTGLDESSAAERLRTYGANELPADHHVGLVTIVLTQFSDFMIIVLLVAAVVSGVLGDLRDAVAIVIIVVLNAAVGAVQEYRAHRAIAALKEMAAPDAQVIRKGTLKTIPASQLVPGDLVKIAAGDVIPADLRLIDSTDLSTDESMLTGESMPVSKDPAALGNHDLAVGDRSNMVYKQTSVTKGAGVGLVVGTGLSTEIGRIASLLTEHKRLQTPLQQRLATFGRRLAIGVLVVCAAIFGLGVISGNPPLLMFLTAVSLAVAAIPEALPAVVTVGLAIGARKLSRQQSLVRRLPAVESLGSVTYICADKTGTLTENRMTVSGFFAANQFAENLNQLDRKLRERVVEILALCNEIDPAHETTGDPTEVALVEAASTSGSDKTNSLRRLPLIDVLTFDSDRKLMTTLHQRGHGAVALTKGAPETVLALCDASLDASGNEVPSFDATNAMAAVDALTRRGNRVLAMALREFESPPQTRAPRALESKMTFIGLVGLHDPIRPSVPQSIRECLTAGIRPLMITGDHPQTALHVAEELGLAQSEANILTGQHLRTLSEDELLQRLRNTHVCARVDPEQKIRIVETLQNAGEFVAMTGDGVNDAPALKQATIGVSMGGRGADVARESSDIVLLDDNFATIVAAVREGRRIYDNIRKFIRYTMTSNTGEICVLVIASLIGMPLPLLPIHILWINLVTDGLPGLAFSAEPADTDIMRRPPRHPKEGVFSDRTWQYMLWVGLLISGLSLSTAAWVDIADVAYWQTMVFTTLVTAQLLQALAMRSETKSLFAIGVFTNPYLLATIAVTLGIQVLIIYDPILGTLLSTAPLALKDLLLCLALGSVVFPVVEIEKRLRRALERS